MMKFKIAAVAGARPNFMKLAPLFRAFTEADDLEVVLVHTGQHYDEQMSGQFFRDLGLPTPQYNLEVGSGSHAQQTAAVMQRFEAVMLAERPDAVLVVGDVNSTVACALVAAKLQVPVIHVEAGLRSFDRAMPEEINRVVTDAIADLLLVSEESGIENLRREGVPAERIYFTGNLMIDTLRVNLERARKHSRYTDQLRREEGPFGIVTLHRPANVDEVDQLSEILGALREISKEMPLYFPVHPRTRAKIKDAACGRITLLQPLGYLDFLALMSLSSVVLTDSGGIQEETTALGIPCLTIRDNTERPITIAQGTNRLAGTRRASILAAWKDLKRAPKVGRIPRYWDGRSAERCLSAIRKRFGLEAVASSFVPVDACSSARQG